jgi:hypothetical protein
LLDIERTMEAQMATRKNEELHKGCSKSTLQEHESDGINEMMKSRYTTMRRQLFPWDTYSILPTYYQSNNPKVEHLNVILAQMGAEYCQWIIKDADLVLEAAQRIEPHKLILRERSAYALAGHERHTICDVCFASLFIYEETAVAAKEHADLVSREHANNAVHLDSEDTIVEKGKDEQKIQEGDRETLEKDKRQEYVRLSHKLYV